MMKSECFYSLGILIIKLPKHIMYLRKELRISRSEENSKTGRPPKLTDDHKTFIAELFFVNPRMTISKARLLFFEKFNCGISHGSISTILKQNHLSYTKPLKVQKLRYYHIILRYSLC